VDLLALLGGFVSQRVKNLSVTEINAIFGGFKMEDTTVGQELIAMGQIKGETIGSLKTLRENVIDVLTTKWTPPGKNVLKRLGNVDDPVALKSLFRALLQARTRKQMQAALDAVLSDGKNGH
jgi:hypothetical protein